MRSHWYPRHRHETVLASEETRNRNAFGRSVPQKKNRKRDSARFRFGLPRTSLTGLCPEPRLGRSRGPHAPRRSLAGAPCAPYLRSARNLGSVNPRTPDRLGSSPVFVENRPQRLVEILAIAQERLPQDAFLQRTHLAERAVAATIRDRSTRLETVRPDDVEREVH